MSVRRAANVAGGTVTVRNPVLTPLGRLGKHGPQLSHQARRLVDRRNRVTAHCDRERSALKQRRDVEVSYKQLAQSRREGVERATGVVAPRLIRSADRSPDIPGSSPHGGCAAGMPRPVGHQPDEKVPVQKPFVFPTVQGV